jgi:hypothetical protein
LNRLLEVGPIESLMIHVHVYYMVSCVVTFTLVFEMFFFAYVKAIKIQRIAQ